MAEQTQSGTASSSNGEKLATVLKNLNWPTVVLIALTGGGNWFATLENRGQIDYTRERVFRQVQDLHDSISEFEKRQKEMLSGIESSLKNQTQILDNQNKTMQSDTKMLEQLHRFAQNYKNPEP